MHPTFIDFIESRLLPFRAEHRQYVRLDGATSGGNREPFGYFHHAGRRWKVHSDTHFEPLLIAYRAVRDREVDDPFETKETKSGRSLALIPELRQRQKSRFKHLYIYAA